MRNFTNNHGEEQFYSFFTMDMPIYNSQLDKLRDELQEHFDNYASEFDKWVWDTCEGVVDDGYGSFRFEWPAEIMNFLTEDQRLRMEQVVNEACCETDIIMSMSHVHSYNIGDAEIETESDVEIYIDTIIDAGYKVDKDDADLVPDHLQNAFDLYFAQLKLTEEVA